MSSIVGNSDSVKILEHNFYMIDLEYGDSVPINNLIITITHFNGRLYIYAGKIYPMVWK
jgi:hypothetical protein